MLATLLPLGAQHGWRVADVRRIVTWIVVSRTAIVSACLAGTFVAVIACGVVTSGLFGGRHAHARASPTSAELWGVFQRAGVAEALLALILSIAVLRYTLLEPPSANVARRAFARAIAAAAAHVTLWPIVFSALSLVLDALQSGEGGGAAYSVDFTSFLCPSLVMCWPFGAAFGLGYMLIGVHARDVLTSPTRRGILEVRMTSLLVGVVAMLVLWLEARGDHLEARWVLAPGSALALLFTIDLVLIVVPPLRERRWLAAVRDGRLPPWRLVPVSEAHVDPDLAPPDHTKGAVLALVHSGGTIYRDVPRAVALVPASETAAHH